MSSAQPLTVEATAGINAFIQDLHNRAAGGPALDEETLALRMLAATHADIESDFSGIKSLNAGSGPVVASADGDDKFAKLTALMMGDTKPPAQQAESGQVPKAPPVVILPGYTNNDVATNYAALMDANSMIQLYANLMQVQVKPEGFNITTEAGAAYNFQAKMAFDAMMGPMAGFFSFSSGSTQTYNDTIPRDQIHANLLGKIFNGFGFLQSTINDLDTQLTNFVGGLSKINPGNTNTYEWSIRLNVVPKRNVTGDDSDPIYIYQPATYVLYLKIDGESFRQSIGKNSSVDKVNFKFSLTVTKCDLNVRKFLQNQDRFDQMFQLITNQNLKSYSALLNKQIPSKEENPGAK